MILAIQVAYYLHARNPSDDQTLVELAAALGLEPNGLRRISIPLPRTRSWHGRSTWRASWARVGFRVRFSSTRAVSVCCA